MISVHDALIILKDHQPAWSVEDYPLSKCVGKKLALDLIAPFNLPNHTVSVMDGYAFRKSDIHVPLTVIGESRAGESFRGTVGPTQAVRIFTGAVLPEGTDFVEIQEHADREGETLTFHTLSVDRNYIREAGSDFRKGDIVLHTNHVITPSAILTLASCNKTSIKVKTPPKVALLRAGDELRDVGANLGPEHIIDANGPGLSALLTSWGIDVIDLGLAKDKLDDIQSRIRGCDADVIVPIGGASVGDYDYMRQAFQNEGFDTLFEKIAVKPGKPTWFATKEKQCVLGLPGNPASAWVCAHIFLKPLLGLSHTKRIFNLGSDLPANGKRETYLRARFDANGHVIPLTSQDSGLVTPLADTDLFIQRLIDADASRAGEDIICIV